MRGVRSTPWRVRLRAVRGEAEGTGGGRRDGGVSAVEPISKDATGEEDETFWKKRKVRDGASLDAKRWPVGGDVSGDGGSGGGGSGNGGGERGTALR